MNVKLSDIDPELRVAGAIARIIVRPSAWYFRFVHGLMRRGAGKDFDNLDCAEHLVPAIDDGPEVRLRVYAPENREADKRLPGVLFLHGGGYAFGIPEMNAGDFKSLMDTRECVVVAPDYRKSIDVPYPAAANDCYSALVWMKEHAAELGIRDDQLIVMGQSAGGGLTAAVTLMARDRGDVKIASQFPLYPMIDNHMTTESARDNNAPVWSSKHNQVGWDLYLGDLSGDDVPTYAAPARETDYSNLPPTTTFVGDLDPFRDETRNYVEALRSANVPVEFQLFERCFHGFDAMGANTKVGKAAARFLHEQFAHAVDNHFAKQT